MHRLYRLAVVYPVLVLGLPLLAADPVNTDKPQDDPKLRSKILQFEFMHGKLKEIDGDGDEKTFLLEVPYKTKVMNPKVAAKIEDLKKQYQKADKNQAKTILQNLSDENEILYEMKEVPFEFSLKSSKDLIVRRLHLQREDQDGKPITYTAEEREKLKGDNPKLPGYGATVKDLEKDGWVRVYLDRGKVRLPSTTAKGKDETVHYPVTMFVIVPAPDPSKDGLKQDPKVRAKMLESLYLDGKLVKADDDEKGGLVLEVNSKVKVKNEAQEKLYNDAVKKVQRNTDAKQTATLLKTAEDLKAKVWEMKDLPYDFPLEYKKDELKVRLLELPAKEDEKGKRIPYTEEEKKKLKGDDPNLIGWNADLKDLTAESLVRVYFDKAKLRELQKKKMDEDETVYYPTGRIVILPAPKEPKEPKEKDKK
jgi:hypothetical protein